MDNPEIVEKVVERIKNEQTLANLKSGEKFIDKCLTMYNEEEQKWLIEKIRNEKKTY